MHANANKLLLLLVAFDFCKLEHVRLLLNLYRNVTGRTASNLHEYECQINKLRFENSDNLSIRFIGDLLADRGKNDFFILLIIKKLVDSGINIRILLSNHDIGFISYYFANYNHPDFKEFLPRPHTSLENLIKTKQQQRLSSELVTPYFSNLLLVDYETEATVEPESKPLLYSHAPTTSQILRKITQELKLVTPISPFNSLSIISTESINAKFQERLQFMLNNRASSQRQWQQLMNGTTEITSVDFAATGIKTNDPEKSFLFNFVWSTQVRLVRQDQLDTNIDYVFGHVGPSTRKDIYPRLHTLATLNYFNLDASEVGKEDDRIPESERIQQGDVPCFVTNNRQLAKQPKFERPSHPGSPADEQTPLLGEPNKKPGCCTIL